MRGYKSHCGRQWLRCTEEKARLKCCFNGRANAPGEPEWPRLLPLSETMRQLLLGDRIHRISYHINRLRHREHEGIYHSYILLRFNIMLQMIHDN